MVQIQHPRSSYYELRVGDTIHIGNLKYIVKRGASGGMGCVLLLLRDLTDGNRSFQTLGLKLALKAVLPSAVDEESARLFKRELTVWSGLRHGNVLMLLDILDGGDAGWVGAMDWCRGSLRDLLKQESKLSLQDASKVIASLLDGLEYAYGKDGVHHLDIKPENVLYDVDIVKVASGTPSRNGSCDEFLFKLSDWGIASIKQTFLQDLVSRGDLDADVIARTFNNAGTLAYMAPERFIEGYSSSSTSDIFSLGMLYAELLTGSLPFRSESDVLRLLLTGSHLSVINDSLKSSGVPKSIRDFIALCIAPRPQNRPQTYQSFRVEFLSAYRSSKSLFNRFF